MLNPLPKNLKLSNSVNEKHLNLLDNIPEVKNEQEDSVVSFIFVLTTFLVILSSCISYLNLKDDILSTSLDGITRENINFIGSKETFIFELKQDINFLSDYKQKSSQIKSKYFFFFETIASLRESLGLIYLDSLVYTNTDNVFDFRISFFSKNKDLEQDIQKLKEVNKRITSIKIESIEKIDGTTEFKYFFNGIIDGR